MEKDRLKKFMEFLRTVEISESLKTDHTNVISYLKTSEREQMITEACEFVCNIIDENCELSILKDDYSARNSELIHEATSLKDNVSKLTRVITNKTK